MNRWLAVPVVLALVLAGCGQDTVEPQAELLESDCALADEVASAASAWIEKDQGGDGDFYEKLWTLQNRAAESWPQVDNGDVKDIIKTLAQPAERYNDAYVTTMASEARQRIYLASTSLSGWQKLNCGS
jgi:hypothetical protein